MEIKDNTEGSLMGKDKEGDRKGGRGEDGG